MEVIQDLKKERKKLLMEVEGLLSLLAKPILVIDPGGQVVHANIASETIWRYSQVTLANKNIIELVNAPFLLELIKKGNPLREYPLELLDADGKNHSYTCRMHPLFVEKQVEGAILQFTEYVEQEAKEKSKKYVTRYTFDDIRGNSQDIIALKERAEKVAKGDSTILIRGESGTGKEVLAQAIHGASLRKDAPFVALNCAAIPESLLESELFGYEEGAFTGAKKGGRAGRFEIANGGTLFLDEIGDMPLYLQAKLLRVLQERRVERVGGAESIKVDVRVMAATHKDLESMISLKLFREDLFYRLNVIPLYVPPLRDRNEDLYELIYFFMSSFGKRFGKEPKRFSSQALQKMFQYPWPGNVRELENVVEYVIHLEMNELITVSSLPESIQNGKEDEEVPIPQKVRTPRIGIFAELEIEKTEEQLIIEAIRQYGNSTEGKRKAAEALGISLSTLYRKLHKIQRKRFLSK